MLLNYCANKVSCLCSFDDSFVEFAVQPANVYIQRFVTLCIICTEFLIVLIIMETLLEVSNSWPVRPLTVNALYFNNKRHFFEIK